MDLFDIIRGISSHTMSVGDVILNLVIFFGGALAQKKKGDLERKV